MRARRSGQLQGWLFIAPALIFVVVFVLVPLGQLVYTSLTDRSLLGGGRFVGFDNYLRIWRDAGFWRVLGFTVKYTIILTPILMGLGYALALLTLDNTPLKRLTRTIVFVPVVIGLSSSSLLWFWLLDEQVGLFNKLLVDLHVLKEPIVWFVSADLAFWAVVISITWKVVGFGMVLFVSGIQSINTDIIEAAIMDGAGYWSRVRRIILPLTRRILLPRARLHQQILSLDQWQGCRILSAMAKNVEGVKLNGRILLGLDLYRFFRRRGQYRCRGLQ